MNENEEPKGDEYIVGPYLRQMKIYKHILMKAHECKMRVLCKWTKPNETRGKTYERKGSEFCNWAFINMDLKIFLRTYK